MTRASPARRTSSSSPSTVAEDRLQVLLIGIGNRYGRDDGAGLEVVGRLRDRAAGAGLGVRELEGEPLALIDAFDGARAAVLVDAVRSGAPPGTSHRADVSLTPLPAALRRAASTHAVGVAEAIELARTLGRLPAAVVVYGLEGQRFDAGLGLTGAVAAAVDGIAEQVLAEACALADGF